MAASIPDQLNFGLFLPSTYTLDIAEVYNVDVNSPEFKELIVRLYQTFNSMLISLNIKDSGYYDLTEFLNSQLFFPDPALTSTTSHAPAYRQDFRKVINFGALPNAGTKSVAHGITINPPAPTTFSFTRIYATATDQVAPSFIPIPYASPVAANNIEINVDAVNVNITTAINYSAYTICYVILEYIKE